MIGKLLSCLKKKKPPPPVFTMKVDIHCHTSRYSGCSIQSPEETVKTAISRGMNCIIITEHFFLWQKEELEEIQNKYPEILILSAIEYSAKSYDMLIYGIPPGFKVLTSPKMDDAIKKRKMRERSVFGKITDSPTVEEVIKYFKPAGCAFVLPHPFRFSNTMTIPDNLLKEFHAMEIDSSNFSQEDRELSLALAKRLNMKTVIASDSHNVSNTAMWYIETPEFKTMNEFVAILKSGNWIHKSSGQISSLCPPG